MAYLMCMKRGEVNLASTSYSSYLSAKKLLLHGRHSNDVEPSMK